VLREWEMVDSAGYSLPNPIDTPGNPHPDNSNLELKDFVSAKNTLSMNRGAAYLSNQWDFVSKNKSEITITAGLRANYWDLNNEFLLAPRASFSYKPDKNPNLVLGLLQVFITKLHFIKKCEMLMVRLIMILNHKIDPFYCW